MYYFYNTIENSRERKASWNINGIKTTFPQELTILKSNYLKMIYELGVAAFIISMRVQLKRSTF
jgi:hypothetical protein